MKDVPMPSKPVNEIWPLWELASDFAALFLRRRNSIIFAKGHILLFFVGLAISGSPAFAAPVRILPLGDSLTAGYTDPPKWTSPYTFGYRGPLYTLLHDAGYDVQFVGSSGEPWSLPFGPVFGVPKDIEGPDLRSLGQDGHRGYGGASVSNLLNGGRVSGSKNDLPEIGAMLNEDNPDIILLMIGINGLPDATANIDALVNKIVTTKPDAQLIIAQITPRSTYQQVIVDYNNYIKEKIVLKYKHLGKNIRMVDQYSNLLTNRNDPKSIDQTLFNDSAHLQEKGYDRLAKTWFRAIKSAIAKEEN